MEVARIECLYCGHTWRAYHSVSFQSGPCRVCKEEKNFRVIKFIDTYGDQDGDEEDTGWEGLD